MKQVRIGLMSLVTAALLAACGGGDAPVPGTGAPAGAPTTKGSFKSLVSFGDSLSDVGTYAPATSLTGDGKPPYIGGKFSTNLDGNLGTIWVENLATQLALPVVKPAEVGFAGTSVKCPVSVVAACTGYGQGGARVTSANGYHKEAGFLTVPVVTQIANHLASAGSFKDSDLIFVWAGDNDLFMQIDPLVAGSFGAAAQTVLAAARAAATQVQIDAAAGKISADDAKAELAAITADASRKVFGALTTGQEAMKMAAQELAGYVRDQILAKGGKYVVVVTPVDIAITPKGVALDATSRGYGTTLVDTFKLWLRDGLTGQPVQWIDANTVLSTIAANASANGLVNVTNTACDAAKTHGSSLFCNGTPGAPYNGLAAGADVNTWLFADDVHPTTGGHKAISNRFYDQLKAFGWI